MRQQEELSGRSARAGAQLLPLAPVSRPVTWLRRLWEPQCNHQPCLCLSERRSGPYEHRTLVGFDQTDFPRLRCAVRRSWPCATVRSVLYELKIVFCV